MMLQIIIFLKFQFMNDFKYLYRNIKSQLLSSYCLDAYGSQLWPFYEESFYVVAWRRTIRKFVLRKFYDYVDKHV